MRLRVVTTASTLLAAALVSAPARAGGTGMEGLEALAYVAGAIVAADLAFTVYDTVEAARGVTPGRGAAIAELLVCGPQIPAALAFARSSGDSERGVGVAFTAWTTALTAHGIWALAATRDGGSGAAAQPPGNAAMTFVGMSGRF